jgi:phosphoribosyl-AMP cyclohydrolase
MVLQILVLGPSNKLCIDVSKQKVYFSVLSQLPWLTGKKSSAVTSVKMLETDCFTNRKDLFSVKFLKRYFFSTLQISAEFSTFLHE